MVGQEFSYSVRRHPDGETVTATLIGEWDAVSDGSLVDAVNAILDEEGYHNVIIDAAALTFCDSSCLGQLVGLHRRTGDRQGWLRVVAPPFAVRRPMELTGLDQVIQITEH
ncbi:STAS domain-containing protein [Cryptosporangium sp. NPDC048952]|uniref:STAS domain-containing protein n=1 Tax=Cryptosporangium sp. NPDC048952 TaxID=3363961 RepID=UPI00371EE69B